MTKKTRTGLIIGVIVVVGLALPKTGLFDSVQSVGADMGGQRDQRIPVRIKIVQNEKIGERVQTVGTILSNEEIEVRSEIAGKVESIAFKEGGRVQKGASLLKMNDDELQARLLSARSRLEMSEQQQERQQQLLSKSLVSQQEYDAVTNELNVVRGEAQLIEAQLTKTTLRAPFDGSVGLRFVSEGSYISPNTLITTLQDISAVKIDFTFPEKYASEIKKGDKIEFTVQGREQKFSGAIYAVAPRIDEATRTVRVRALSPNPNGLLIPGAFANVEVQLREKEGLAVPAFAVIPELKRHKVYVYNNGTAEERVVELGARTEDRVEVAQGLESGDSLIISGILQLRPGMAVRLSESPGK
ncbi:MAG: efflux RND transporter periplasmic adaptor subunit [Bacteroidota bacterium]